DQIGELRVEVREAQAQAVMPELLVDAHVPREGLLGLEARVGESREEQVVEGRRPEAAAGAAMQPRAPLLHEVSQRAPPGRRAAERAVVLDSDARRHEQTVEEAELLLEQARDGLRVGREGVGASDVGLLVSPLDAERRRAPRADVEMAQALDLVARGLEGAGKVAGR